MLEFSFTKKLCMFGIICIGILYALPNILPQSIKESGIFSELRDSILPGKTVNLGLDLQGGAHLLLEIDTDNLIIEQYDALKDEVRNLLRAEKIGYRNLKSTPNKVIFTPRKNEDRKKISEVLYSLTQRATYNDLGTNKAIEFVFKEDHITQLHKNTLEQTVKIIRRRIDELGTREPIIQPQGAKRIIVQAPGEDDPQKLKRTLGKTAKLTFHLLHKDYPTGFFYS